MASATATPAPPEARTAPRAFFWLLLAGVLVAVALVARAPGLTGILFDRDEAHVAVEAQTIMRGERLYEDVIDRKPPLVPAAVAGIFALSGSEELWAVRLALALWVAATGAVVAAIVVRRGGSRRAGAVAGVLAVLGTVAFLPGDGQASNFELWGALPAAAAVLCALPARAVGTPARWWALAASGALVVVAASCKQPYLATVVPVAYLAWRSPPRWGRLGAVALGGALAGGVVLTAFGTEQLRWAWIDTNDYLSGGQIVRGVFVLAPVMTLLFVATQAPAVFLAARAVMHGWREQLIVLVWLVAALVAAAAGFRFLGHYYQQVLAPLCVLAGAGVDRVSLRAARLVVGGAAAIAAIAVVVALLPVSDQREPVAESVDYVQANTAPDDAILVWGAFPEVYWKSDRRLAGGFVHHGFLTGFWAGGPAQDDEVYDERWEEFLDDLRTDRPVLIIDSSPTNVGEFERYPINDSPLQTFLDDEGYVRVGVFDGMPIWRLPDSLRPATSRVASAGFGSTAGTVGKAAAPATIRDIRGGAA